jgi:hypothetical protein
MSMASFTPSLACRLSVSRRSLPSTYSIVMNLSSSASPSHKSALTLR